MKGYFEDFIGLSRYELHDDSNLFVSWVGRPVTAVSIADVDILCFLPLDLHFVS